MPTAYRAVNALDRNVDFIVIDTPGTDSYLSRLAHSTADTLITPMNDSLLDFDVLGSVDPTTYAVTGVAHYAAMVRQVRRRRRQLDGSNIDWIVMRNRRSGLSSRSTHVLSGCRRQLSLELGFDRLTALSNAQFTANCFLGECPPSTIPTQRGSRCIRAPARPRHNRK